MVFTLPVADFVGITTKSRQCRWTPNLFERQLFRMWRLAMPCDLSNGTYVFHARTLVAANWEKRIFWLYLSGLQRTLTPLVETGVAVPERCAMNVGGAQCTGPLHTMYYLSVIKSWSHFVFCTTLITPILEIGSRRTLLIVEWKTTLRQCTLLFTTLCIHRWVGKHQPRHESLWSHTCRLHDSLNGWSKVAVECSCWTGLHWLSYQEDWMWWYTRNAEIDWEGIHHQGQEFKMSI